MCEFNTNATCGTVAEVCKRLPEFFTISVASRRNSGKTVIVTQIIKELLKTKRVDKAFVISGSAGLNDDYTDVLPKSLIREYDNATLPAIWAMNKKKDPKERKHILVIMDDCLSNPECYGNTDIIEVYVKGRHNHISIIMLSQHTAHLLNPTIRANSDLILYSKLNLQQLKGLYGSITNLEFNDFKAYSEANAGHDYQFIYLDTYKQTNKADEFLGVVKADPPSTKKKKKDKSEHEHEPEPEPEKNTKAIRS